MESSTVTTDQLLSKISDQLGELIELSKNKPQIVYSISLGNMMEIANAPAGLFQPEFTERLASDMQSIIRPKRKVVEEIKESKIIDLTNSNNYKA